MTLDQPAQIREYCNIYLGNSQSVDAFADAFVAQRDFLLGYVSIKILSFQHVPRFITFHSLFLLFSRGRKIDKPKPSAGKSEGGAAIAGLSNSANVFATLSSPTVSAKRREKAKQKKKNGAQDADDE